jgi:hypothetical protein
MVQAEMIIIKKALHISSAFFLAHPANGHSGAGLSVFPIAIGRPPSTALVRKASYYRQSLAHRCVIIIK